MVKLREPKLEVSDDVEHGNSSAIDGSSILNRPLKLQESTMKPDELKGRTLGKALTRHINSINDTIIDINGQPPYATTEYTVPDPSIQHGGCNQRTKTSNTVTGAHPESNTNPEAKPIYSDQMLKIALKDGKEEPNAALAKKQALVSLSLIVGRENRKSDSESSSLTSVVELEDRKSKHGMKTDPGEEDKVPTAVKLQDGASVADRSNSIWPKKPQKQNVKREIEQNVLTSKRLQQVENAPSASLSKTIGGRMSGIVNKCANINKPLTGKIMEEFVLAIHSEAKHPALAPDVSAVYVCQQQRKRQKTSNAATSMRVTHKHVRIGDAEAEVSGSGCKAKPLMIKHEKSDDLRSELGILPCPAEVRLESLKVNDLRAIAKEHKLRNYYKLTKKSLVEQIANKLGRC